MADPPVEISTFSFIQGHAFDRVPERHDEWNGG